MAKHDNATGNNEKTTTKADINPIQPRTLNASPPVSGAIGANAKPNESKSDPKEKSLPWFVQAVTKPEWLTVIVTTAA